MAFLSGDYQLLAASMATGGTMRNSAIRVPSRFRISKRNP
jgi:hypothetical protein